MTEINSDIQQKILSYTLSWSDTGAELVSKGDNGICFLVYDLPSSISTSMISHTTMQPWISKQYQNNKNFPVICNTGNHSFFLQKCTHTLEEIPQGNNTTYAMHTADLKQFCAKSSAPWKKMMLQTCLFGRQWQVQLIHRHTCRVYSNHVTNIKKFSGHIQKNCHVSLLIFYLTGKGNNITLACRVTGSWILKLKWLTNITKIVRPMQKVSITSWFVWRHDHTLPTL